MTKPNPELTDDENPEWTDAMFADARPAFEGLGGGFCREGAAGTAEIAESQGRSENSDRRRGGGAPAGQRARLADEGQC